MPPFSEAPPSPEHPFCVRNGDENQEPSAVHHSTMNTPTDLELSPKSVIGHAFSSAQQEKQQHQQQPSPESTRLRSLVQERIYQQWKTLSSQCGDPHATRKGILKRHSGHPSKKNVTFSTTTPNTRIIPNVSIWNDPELALSVWYSKQEFRDMQEQCEFLLDLWHLGIIPPQSDEGEGHNSGTKNGSTKPVVANEECHSIGFESCFGEAREVAEALQIGGRAAVFLEQQTQFRGGYYCDELIRSGYSEFSERAEEIARQRGQNMVTAAGDWVYQGLTTATVQWMYSQGNCKPLERLVAQQLTNHCG